MATSATSNNPVERLRISSLGNIKQNLTSPSGTSPFQNTHWYDRQGGHYTLTAIDDNYLSFGIPSKCIRRRKLGEKYL